MKVFIVIFVTLVITLVNAQDEVPDSITDLRLITPITTECEKSLKGGVMPVLNMLLDLLPALGSANDAIFGVFFKQMLETINNEEFPTLAEQYLAVVVYTVAMKKENVLIYYKQFILDQVSIILDQFCFFVIEDQSYLYPSLIRH